jgi:acetate kinase
MGIVIDAQLNEQADGDLDISLERSAVKTLVIRAREDLEIARQSRAVLRGSV